MLRCVPVNGDHTSTEMAPQQPAPVPQSSLQVEDFEYHIRSEDDDDEKLQVLMKFSS